MRMILLYSGSSACVVLILFCVFRLFTNWELDTSIYAALLFGLTWPLTVLIVGGYLYRCVVPY